MEQKGKVYVNPNFKPLIPPQHGRMYVNPLFPKQSPNIRQFNNANTTKIHVNPNFIRPNIAANTVKQNQHKVISNENNLMEHKYLTNQGISKQTLKPETSDIMKPVYRNRSKYSFVRQSNSQSVVSNVSESDIGNRDFEQKPCTSYLPLKTSLIATKSRYSLVRAKQNTEIQIVPKESTMIKIGKYKSVAIENVRKNLDTSGAHTKPGVTLKCQVFSPKRKVLISTTTSSFKSKYKFVKGDISLKTKGLKSAVTRKLSASMRKESSNLIKSKNKKQFKINNLPCALFRKFGKCLRNERGTCDFLHDKNHVSICRKYLSGSCHDSNCLLSHDISLKKMPTCSFYLRGMCTKENCPYLHVKLNVKTKICTEFTKGFCVKGDNCLYRHVNMCPNIASKGICFKKQCQYPHPSTANSKLNKSIKLKTIKPNMDPKSKYENKINQLSNKRKSKGKLCVDTNVPGNRYYANIDNTETLESEVIKPVRTKLGNLPSFIQL